MPPGAPSPIRAGAGAYAARLARRRCLRQIGAAAGFRCEGYGPNEIPPWERGDDEPAAVTFLQLALQLDWMSRVMVIGLC
jgi:hypothetical protein